MKKSLLPFLLVLSGIFGNSQSPCLPEVSGVTSGDYPPGCTICGIIYEGSTAGYYADSLKYDFPCGQVENSQWVSMIADSSGLIAASVLASNCLNNQGVEYAIYDEKLNLISECKSSSGTNDTPPAVQGNNLVPGNVYYLMIDGVNGDECEILVVQNGGSGQNYSQEPIRIKAEPQADRYCIGAEVCFSIDRIPGAYEYLWEGPSNLDSLRGGGILDTFYCVEFNNVGGGILSVTPNFDCGAGVTSITPAIALPILPTNVSLSVCADELPIKFADREFNDFGTYQFSILSSLGCDSFLNFTLVESVIIPMSIDTTICAGTCVQIQDTCFWESASDIDLYCLLIDELNISFIDSFPAPEIECNFNNSNRNFSWNEVVGAEGYLVIINGDTFPVQTWTNLRIPDITIDSQITIRVLPIADNNCIFKAGELTCPESSEVANNNFGNELEIFPNPTSGNIEIKTRLEINEIQVFNLSGSKIFEQNTGEINLSNVSSGIYFLKIKTDNGLVVKKIIRE